MANKKQEQKEQTGFGMRIFVAFLALVIFAVVVLGGMQLWAPANVKPSGWFGGNVEQGNAENADLVSGNMVVNGDEAHGISVLSSSSILAENYEEYGIDTQALNAATFRFTVTNDATDKTLEASLTFKNASSSWAQGKTVTNYVMAAVNGLQVTTTCKAEFGEQIILKVSAKNNPECFVNLNLDYIKHVTSASVQFKKGAANTTTLVFGDNATYTASVNPTYGVGTITPTLSSGDSTITLSADFSQKIGSGTSGTCRAKSYSFTSLVSNSDFYGNFIEYVGGPTVSEATKKNAFIRAVNNSTGNYATLSAEYTATYDGNTISEGTVTLNLTFDVSNLTIAVTEISSDKTGAYFY